MACDIKEVYVIKRKVIVVTLQVLRPAGHEPETIPSIIVFCVCGDCWFNTANEQWTSIWRRLTGTFINELVVSCKSNACPVLHLLLLFDVIYLCCVALSMCQYKMEKKYFSYEVNWRALDIFTPHSSVIWRTQGGGMYFDTPLETGCNWYLFAVAVGHSPCHNCR